MIIDKTGFVPRVSFYPIGELMELLSFVGVGRIDYLPLLAKNPGTMWLKGIISRGMA